MLETLLAVFIGAFLAFKLEGESRKREEIKKNVAASNSALFVILRQLNSLKLFQRDMIDPHRSDTAISINMDPLLQETHDDLDVDFKSLDFILGTKHQKALIEIYLLQQRFREATKAINHRSKLHYEQIQPVLAESDIGMSGLYEREYIAKVLGEKLFDEIVRITDQVVTTTDDTIKSSETALNKFLSALKDIYPKAKFLNFTVIS